MHMSIKLGFAALALSVASSVYCQEARSGKGLHEIPDPELGLMRGRYTVGNNSVAWFGVTMISTWQTQTGQRLQGALTLGMDFSKGGTPKISFSPSVSVTEANAPLPETAGVSRSIEGSGLGNVAGLSQSVQIAGDGNRAFNVADLRIRSGDAPSAGAGQDSGAVSASNGSATAVAGFDGNSASVLLQVEGQGAVQQWVRAGSVGQMVQLGADGQLASNRLEIELVRNGLGANLPLSQNVAQAINLTRGIGLGP